jgi:hypothetical protein
MDVLVVERRDKHGVEALGNLVHHFVSPVLELMDGAGPRLRVIERCDHLLVQGGGLLESPGELREELEKALVLRDQAAEP